MSHPFKKANTRVVEPRTNTCVPPFQHATSLGFQVTPNLNLNPVLLHTKSTFFAHRQACLFRSRVFFIVLSAAGHAGGPRVY